MPFDHVGFKERVAKYPFRSRSAAENLAMSSGMSNPAKYRCARSLSLLLLQRFACAPDLVRYSSRLQGGC